MRIGLEQRQFSLIDTFIYARFFEIKNHLKKVIMIEQIVTYASIMTLNYKFQNTILYYTKKSLLLLTSMLLYHLPDIIQGFNLGPLNG